jgi:hypothetical protein
MVVEVGEQRRDHGVGRARHPAAARASVCRRRRHGFPLTGALPARVGVVGDGESPVGVRGEAAGRHGAAA